MDKMQEYNPPELELTNLECIGHFGVDAGICWIGDPCYILHREGGREPKAIGKDWHDFCNILYRQEGSGQKDWWSFNYDMGHEGLGICVNTCWGDGSYPVFIQRNSDGRISKVIIDFEPSFNGSEDASDVE